MLIHKHEHLNSMGARKYGEFGDWMKAFAPAIFLLALLSAACAESYSMAYQLQGWAKVSRNITATEPSGCAAITGACSATGAYAGSGVGGATRVALTVENAGLADREGVLLTEDTSYAPADAKIAFSPNASWQDGRLVSWNLGKIKKGEKKSVSYLFLAVLPKGRAELVSEPKIESETPVLLLSAPSSATVGERVPLAVRTASGELVPGAKIAVSSPAGIEQEISTGLDGTASFAAKREGFYTYSIEGYRLARLVSTQMLAKEEEAAPLVSAASDGADSGLLAKAMGALPLLGGILAAAIIALAAYSFFSSRDERYEPAPQQGSATGSPAAPATQGGASSAPLYTQRYVFGAEKSEKEAATEQDTIRSLVEKRKAKMQAREVAAVEPKQNHQPLPIAKEEAGDDVERELAKLEAEARKEGEVFKEDNRAEEEAGDDVERELAKLEAEARKEGEVLKEDYELEKAIAELEAIRQKLRERKGEFEETEAELERQIAQMEREEAPSAATKPYKPQPQKPAQAAAKPAPSMLPKGNAAPKAKPQGKK